MTVSKRKAERNAFYPRFAWVVVESGWWKGRSRDRGFDSSSHQPVVRKETGCRGEEWVRTRAGMSGLPSSVAVGWGFQPSGSRYRRATLSRR